MSRRSPDLWPVVALIAGLVLFAFLLDSALGWVMRRFL